MEASSISTNLHGKEAPPEIGLDAVRIIYNVALKLVCLPCFLESSLGLVDLFLNETDEE